MPLDPMQDFLGKMYVWNSLRAETLHYAGKLDNWLMFIIGLMVVLIALSFLDKVVDPRFGVAMAAAAMLGAGCTPWTGRIDVLIHRPAPGVRAIEDSFGPKLVEGAGASTRVQSNPEPALKGWENWYKRQLRWGVKALVPLDLIVGIFLFAMFLYANNAAYDGYLKDWAWRLFFWRTCLAVHLFGWIVIFAAPKIAE